MKQKPTKSFIGAVVRYCGHHGTFIADLLQVGTAVVVHVSQPVSMENLNRELVDYAGATHELVDFPKGGFWKPGLGIFVVPEDQVRIVPHQKVAA